MSTFADLSFLFPISDSAGSWANYLYLLLGLGVLLLSGESLVRGGVSLGRKTGVSELVIGVTVVSLGTSAPELVVSLQAALSGHPDIAIGNVVGSNISNIGLVLALTVLIFPFAVNRMSLTKDGPFMLVISVMVIIFSVDGRLNRIEGLILLLLVTIYTFLIIRNSRLNSRLSLQKIPAPAFPVPLAILIVLLSGVGLIIGASWLVHGASGAARSFGVSERVISLSIVALGTSLPEMSASLMAALRKHPDVSVGNIIGSNIFNIGGILGTTALFVDIDINPQIRRFDYWYMLVLSVLMLLLVGKKLKLTRWKGFVMILFYVCYIVLIYARING